MLSSLNTASPCQINKLIKLSKTSICFNLFFRRCANFKRLQLVFNWNIHWISSNINILNARNVFLKFKWQCDRFIELFVENIIKTKLFRSQMFFTKKYFFLFYQNSFSTDKNNNFWICGNWQPAWFIMELSDTIVTNVSEVDLSPIIFEIIWSVTTVC